MTETTNLLVAFAEQAGLPVTSQSQARLEPPVRHLHRAVLKAFLDTGTAPTGDWLHDQAAALGLDLDAAVPELAEADLIHLSDGSVAVAYPFSGVPTADHVYLEGGPALWAMCAIDALGILFMTGRDGTIAATDPQDGESIQVQRHGADWDWTPETTVVLAAVGPACGRAAESACPHMSFHAHAEPAEAYLRAHPELTGYVLDHDQALEVADFAFGPLLREPE
jgi:alkylmercury lyase